MVAQEFLPTDVRLAHRRPRPAAALRLQVLHGRRSTGRSSSATATARPPYGRYETLPVGARAAASVRTALKAANLIGDGLYGVDLKQSDGKFYVIEVNDNPNLDAGFEDARAQATNCTAASWRCSSTGSSSAKPAMRPA